MLTWASFSLYAKPGGDNTNRSHLEVGHVITAVNEYVLTSESFLWFRVNSALPFPANIALFCLLFPVSPPLPPPSIFTTEAELADISRDNNVILYLAQVSCAQNRYCSAGGAPPQCIYGRLFTS